MIFPIWFLLTTGAVFYERKKRMSSLITQVIFDDVGEISLTNVIIKIT
jgi:hypothetical protein